MVEIAFCVRGHPPKKTSDKSMWSTDNQVPLLIELRNQALMAREKAGINAPLNTKLSLELNISGSKQEHYEIGDLMRCTSRKRRPYMVGFKTSK